MIPNIQHSERGKTTETAKRSGVLRGSRAEKRTGRTDFFLGSETILYCM